MAEDKRIVYDINNFMAGDRGEMPGRHAALLDPPPFSIRNLLVYRNGSVGPRSGLQMLNIYDDGHGTTINGGADWEDVAGYLEDDGTLVVFAYQGDTNQVQKMYPTDIMVDTDLAATITGESLGTGAAVSASLGSDVNNRNILIMNTSLVCGNGKFALADLATETNFYSALGGATDVIYAVLYQTRLFLSIGNNAVFYSDPSDVDDVDGISSTQFFRVGPFRGGPRSMRAMFVLGNSLYFAFKAADGITRMYEMTGANPATATIRQILDNMPEISPGGFAVTREGMFFPGSGRQLCMFDGRTISYVNDGWLYFADDLPVYDETVDLPNSLSAAHLPRINSSLVTHVNNNLFFDIVGYLRWNNAWTRFEPEGAFADYQWSVSAINGLDSFIFKKTHYPSGKAFYFLFKPLDRPPFDIEYVGGGASDPPTSFDIISKAEGTQDWSTTGVGTITIDASEIDNDLIGPDIFDPDGGQVYPVRIQIEMDYWKGTTNDSFDGYQGTWPDPSFSLGIYRGSGEGEQLRQRDFDNFDSIAAFDGSGLSDTADTAHLYTSQNHKPKTYTVIVTTEADSWLPVDWFRVALHNLYSVAIKRIVVDYRVVPNRPGRRGV